MTKLYTFGDSILDCAAYNDLGATPGALLARNDDRVFPEFRGRDLASLCPDSVTLVHGATDGATAHDLRRQIGGTHVPDDAIVLLTVGGNDLLQRLLAGDDCLPSGFEQALRSAVERLRYARLFLGNVYDPSFGDDTHDVLGIEPRRARQCHAQLNGVIARIALDVGARLVDLHTHFLSGTPAWFSHVIEPSAVGASEARRVFLAAWEA